MTGSVLEALRERQRALGAEHGELRGRRGALRFGEVEREHARLRDAAAVADGLDRVLLEVRGAKARETFGGLVTQPVESLQVGRAVYAFMLTAKGRPVAEMRVVRLEDAGDGGEERLLLDLPSACREGADEHFGRYLPPRLARVTDRDDLARLSVVGPAADDVLAALVEADGLPGEPLAVAEAGLGAVGGRGVVVRREAATGRGLDLYLPADRAAEAWEELTSAAGEVGGGPAGLEAREVLRVELGVPRYGPEIGLDVLPQETGQQGRAVSFEKGCYTGQEVVARIHYRGKVNRHLRGLRLSANAELPAGGEPLSDGERERGSLTTAVDSPAEGPIALAYVRREVDPGAELRVGAADGPPAEVVELPLRAADRGSGSEV